MDNYPIYVGGEFVTTAQKLEVSNPYSGKAFAVTYKGGRTELDKAIAKAQEVKEKMRTLPAYKRYEILLGISNAIRTGRERLASVLCRESAKPYRYAIAEIDRAAQTFLVAAEESKRLPKEYISLDWTPAGEGKEGLVKYFPVGIVAGIAPFNFPMNLAVHKIAPAIAAGCPIILKPASATPLSTLELARIIDATDLPKGAVSIIPADREVGNQLVTDERLAMLSFTGSPPVGWKMKKDAGKKKVVLELGGNAAVIVTPSADVSHAVKRSLIGAFAYSGQVCIHAQRFYVHEQMYKVFLERLVEGTITLRHGHPEDPATEVSSMIDHENASRVEEWVCEAVAQGAKVLLGGRRRGCFFEPTIVTNTNNSMKVVCEEIFGPVITIEMYSDFKEAVRMVNDSTFGLQAGVFTGSAREIDYAFEHLNVGGVIINDVPTFRADHMPYGGIKDSGLGREGVKYAIMDMMEAKILVK
jgi:acyl-CoA reductase-like NAD-dependent aldehyde dehydrogenase